MIKISDGMSTFDKLVEFRKKLRIKQKDIAKELGYSKSTLSKYEHGVRKISAEDQDKYAEYLDIKLTLTL